MRTLALGILFICFLQRATAAQVPPSFVDSVVAIGFRGPMQVMGAPSRDGWFTEGTGFFYGYLVMDDPDPKKRQYEIFLVTARHVIEGHMANQQLPSLSVRLNAKDKIKGVQEFQVATQAASNSATWFFHPDKTVDVAILRVDLEGLKTQGFEPGWFARDLTSADIEKLKSLEVSAGDGIYVLGFPMNLAGEQKNYVIVREGIIARVSEMLDAASRTFMIDSLVFPGNSGGPVILKPEIAAIQGTKVQSSSLLIGVVLSYIPYTDVAVSGQTHHPRVTFEENSGLAEVLPVDYINQSINAWHASVRQTPTPIKKR